MGALVTNWYAAMPSPLAHLALAMVGVIAGALIGYERERKEKPAGLRTMALVSLGAVIFTMLSLYLAGETGDRGRVAAQIVTGVGFLGAGAILRGPLGVTGVTTAATVWVVAAIGTVVGAGFGTVGLILGAAVAIFLSVVARIERRYLGACVFRITEMVFDGRDGKALVRIEDVLDEYQIGADSRHDLGTVDGMSRLRISYCNAHRHHKELLTRLADLPDVREMRRGPTDRT